MEDNFRMYAIAVKVCKPVLDEYHSMRWLSLGVIFDWDYNKDLKYLTDAQYIKMFESIADVTKGSDKVLLKKFKKGEEYLRLESKYKELKKKD
jgi:hypothetical protein